MTWQRIPLGECVDVVSGPAFKSQRFTDDPEDVPLIKGENIGQGVILWDKSKYWPLGDVDSYSRYWLEPGDIVLAMDRPWVPAGLKWARIREHHRPSLLVQRVARLRARDCLCQDFLEQIIRTDGFCEYVRNLMGGTNVPHISGGQIRSFEILVPSKEVQKSIAEILSAYDNLIENNRRRMTRLEESARLLYREWFVRLRFPGYEHTKVVDGAPNGWEHVSAPEAIYINPKTPLSDGEEHWSVEMADLPINNMVVSSAVRSSNRSGSKFRNGDTLFARITPCLENGKTAFVNFMEDGEVGRGSTEFIVLRSKRVTPEFVYCLSRTYEFRENAIKSMIGSSGRRRVQESCFDKFFIAIPPEPLLRMFELHARPIFEQIRLLQSQNQKLRAARDLLLPKLMSGELSV